MSTSPCTCAHTCQPFHPPHAAHTRPARPRARPSPTARLPSCAQNFSAQSLATSRLTLLHLYVPLTFQSIGQRGDSSRQPAGRIRLRFPRFSCTQTAICAVAVNHPHHTNHVNHSSNKCQPSLIHALPPVNPSIRRTRPALARRDHARGLRQPPRLPCCAQHFLPNLTQSLVISRVTLMHLSCPSTPSTATKMLPI